jgi:hypothetical protein
MERGAARTFVNRVQHHRFDAADVADKHAAFSHESFPDQRQRIRLNEDMVKDRQTTGSGNKQSFMSEKCFYHCFSIFVLLTQEIVHLYFFSCYNCLLFVLVTFSCLFLFVPEG